MKDPRKLAIDKILAEGADMTEENIQSVMRASNAGGLESDLDEAMADELLRVLQALRAKQDIPKAVEMFGRTVQAALNAGLEKLARSFREHGHAITVNPQPITIEKPEIKAPVVPGRKETMPKLRFVFHRDMNGLIEYMTVEEDRF